MPQMSPMNWAFLFLLFNSCLALSVCKLHFMYKEKHFSEMWVKSGPQASLAGHFSQIK